MPCQCARDEPLTKTANSSLKADRVVTYISFNCHLSHGTDLECAPNNWMTSTKVLHEIKEPVGLFSEFLDSLHHVMSEGITKIYIYVTIFSWTWQQSNWETTI
eukprot:1769605-Amphidinium_carterae.1